MQKAHLKKWVLGKQIEHINKGMPNEVILIAAVTVDGFVARHDREVTTWSKDLRQFKEQTLGHPVVMGSNTYDTLAAELEGRRMIVIHRDDNPKEILNNIEDDRCFIIGGGKTYARFASFLTHLYITPHPFIFGKGISLFDEEVSELKLDFQKIISVDEKNGIFQYQYKVLSS
ncbi:MAG: dihydrofolate reductase [Candidatus Marinimicrobia bacterium]|nr:dihydrofolate reductase [Candidatus Neomarinimicrobiota bacterium]MBT5460314.1 dihydrofolate reductase [Candidatus Neomarinimicrobiota bacterium]MBT5760017.1 dihydrofolate reductase [Candidatus Neomarinimicrobiota bacterium]MBT7278529.1 dihydrofolate reductase [Candidatus Neomarinimicrobiota bacterium]